MAIVDIAAMQEQIVEAVAQFERTQMSLNPSSILANLQANTLFVMLEGLSIPAERACRQDAQVQGLLEQYHSQVYETVRHLLEPEIEQIIGRTVERSTFRADPVSGVGTMQFTLGDYRNKQ